jgi:hypothetical protein
VIHDGTETTASSSRLVPQKEKSIVTEQLPSNEPNGTTFARSEESYDGLVARALRRSLQSTLDTALGDGASCLKAEAEKPSPEAS